VACAKDPARQEHKQLTVLLNQSRAS
jgi:hypothetical protein